MECIIIIRITWCNMNYSNSSQESRLNFLQRSGVQPLERLTAFGIMGVALMAPLNPSVPYCRDARTPMKPRGVSLSSGYTQNRCKKFKRRFCWNLSNYTNFYYSTLHRVLLMSSVYRIGLKILSEEEGA